MARALVIASLIGASGASGLASAGERERMLTKRVTVASGNALTTQAVNPSVYEFKQDQYCAGYQHQGNTDMADTEAAAKALCEMDSQCGGVAQWTCGGNHWTLCGITDPFFQYFGAGRCAYRKIQQAAAVGDPHLQNMFGERFDLAKPGKSILVSIPRGTPVEDALLVVQADARQLGARCSDMYFQEINITGKWTNADLRYTAQVVNDETPQWSKFGPVELKVAHGHTEKGVTYLNLYVRHLGLAGAAVGGLLGEDDHTEAAAPSAACRKTMSLAKHATRSTSELQDASVAFAAAL